MKKKIFIGCSSQELELAREAKALLIDRFEVTIWDENIWDNNSFKLNEFILANLLKASLLYDFGLLLGTDDDVIQRDGKILMQPRDNVLFELGLFTGRMGISKCAFLVDTKINLLSDFNGLSLAQFERNNRQSFENAVNQIKELFLSITDDEINFFPSTTLAYTYFENFILPVCKGLIENNGIEVDDKKYLRTKIEVIIPDKINHDVNLQFEQLKSAINTKSVIIKYAGRPRTINIDTRIHDDTIVIIDFPTIISGINFSILNLLPNEFNKSSNTYHSILERELYRFTYTLKKLLSKHGFQNMILFKKTSEFN
ncbi:MAG: nucleotide-binding protein [Bacteroidia bacterium]|jgi:hypothetical protein|nr:nucleotide-binding protein [Bacteroidia bacterium]